MIDLLPHIVQLAVEIEILQDPQNDCLAGPAGTDGIEHPQNHPSNELPRAFLQLNFAVQDAPPSVSRFKKAVWEKPKPRCYFALGPTTLSSVLNCRNSKNGKPLWRDGLT